MSTANQNKRRFWKRNIFQTFSLTADVRVDMRARVYLPTTSSSISVAFLRILLQMSMVKMVELELKMDVREDISAAIITAIMIPRRPEI